MSKIETSEVLSQWRESAKHWAFHSATIRTMFAPVTRALLEQTGIREGQSVLDVAAGPGEPSLTIAEKVGPSGAVMCTDAVVEMVQAAQVKADAHGLKNVHFCQCTADSLPFSNDSFDVVVSRLGAMFFPDPLAACRELLRVMKPGGALGFAVWHKSDLNPFCYLVTGIMSRFVETPPADPDALGAFRFAETGKLAGVMTEAGAVNINERILRFEIAAPLSPEEFWVMRSQTSDTLRQKLSNLSESERMQIAREVSHAVR